MWYFVVHVMILILKEIKKGKKQKKKERREGKVKYRGKEREKKQQNYHLEDDITSMLLDLAETGSAKY
jgi:hypothetical protein